MQLPRLLIVLTLSCCPGSLAAHKCFLVIDQVKKHVVGLPRFFGASADSYFANCFDCRVLHTALGSQHPHTTSRLCDVLFATLGHETLVGCTQQHQQLHCCQHLNSVLGDMKRAMSPTVAVLLLMLLNGADAARLPDLFSMFRGKSVSPADAGSPPPPNFPDSYEVRQQLLHTVSKATYMVLCKPQAAVVAMCHLLADCNPLLLSWDCNSVRHRWSTHSGRELHNPALQTVAVVCIYSSVLYGEMSAAAALQKHSPSVLAAGTASATHVHI